MERIKKYFKENWPLIFIFFLGLLPLTWFKDGAFIAGGDNSQFLDPGSNFFDYFNSWWGKMDTGSPNLFKSSSFPGMFFWLILEKIGLSVLDIQRIWLFFLTFFLPGILMYLLVREIYSSSGKKGVIAGFFASFIYVFNQYMMMDILKFRFFLSFLPLLFLLWYKGLRLEKFSLKYSILFALVSGLCASDSVNFAYVAPIAMIFLIYFIFQLRGKRYFIKSFLFLLTTVVFVLLVNFWWIFSFLISLKSSGNAMFSFLKTSNSLTSSSIHEVFRFMGFWAFRLRYYYDGLKLVDHVPYAFRYYQLPLLLTTYLIPFFAFASLLFVKQRREKIFFSIIALLGIFLTKGSNPPFGFFYQFLFDKLSFFSAFREPFSKFMTMHLFAIPILAGFFLEDIYCFLQGKFKKSDSLNHYLGKFLLMLAVLAVFANGFPLLTGNNVQNKDWYGDTKASLWVKIPDYWKEAKNWFSQNDPQSRIMLSPKTFYGYSHSWESGVRSGEPVARFLLPNPIIRYPTVGLSKSDRLQIAAFQLMFFNGKIDMLPFFDLLGVGYVLQQNDVFQSDPLAMQSILKAQQNLNLVKSFGKLDLYQTEGKTTKFAGSVSGLDIYQVMRKTSPPLIYSPNQIVNIDGSIDSFFDIFTFENYSPKTLFVFSEDSKQASLAEINYSKTLINLKKKKVESDSAEEAIYRFWVPVAGNYRILTNSYLLTPEFNKNDKKFYINLGEKQFSIFSETENYWQEIKDIFLGKGEHLLKTNLLVKNINDEYMTSPLWLAREDTESEKINSPSLAFNKINPSKYKVEIDRTDQPYFLILGESFNPKWKIYYGKKEVSSGEHFIANGFANGWQIDPSLFAQTEKGVELFIEYIPQRIDNIGLIISLFTTGVFLVSLFFIFINKDKES